VSGQLHASAALTPGEKAPSTTWIGDWVASRASMDVGGKRKNALSLPEIESQLFSPWLSHYNDSADPAPMPKCKRP